MQTNEIEIIYGNIEGDMPQYEQIHAGHYDVRGSGYCVRRPAGTNDWLIVLTLSGQGRFGQEKNRLVVNEYDIVMIRPGTPHHYGTLSESNYWNLAWAHFHPRTHWRYWMTWPEHTPGVMYLAFSNGAIWSEVCNMMHRAHQYASGRTRLAHDIAMNALEQVLLCCAADQPTEVYLDERILAVLQYIDAHLAESLDLEILANVVALSTSRFAHLFTAQIGQPPMKYVDSQRMQRAKQLLERTNVSVTKIADDIGFDPVSFSRRFKQISGFSPRAYRELMRSVDLQ